MKKYTIAVIPSLLSRKPKYVIGTLAELKKEFAHLLERVGANPRNIDSLVRALNKSQKGREGTYTHATFFREA